MYICLHLLTHSRVCVQKFPDWVHNEIYTLTSDITRWEATQRLWRQNSLDRVNSVPKLYKKNSSKLKTTNGDKLFLCFNWTPRPEGVLGEWRHSFTHYLTSGLDGGEWSALCLGSFSPRERTPGIHWIGGWVGPRAGLDAMVISLWKVRVNSMSGFRFDGDNSWIIAAKSGELCMWMDQFREKHFRM